MENNTQIRFKELLKEFNRKLETSSVKYEDALELIAYSQNLFIRYEEMIKSRDKWKEKAIKKV